MLVLNRSAVTADVFLAESGTRGYRSIASLQAIPQEPPSGSSVIPRLRHSASRVPGAQAAELTVDLGCAVPARIARVSEGTLTANKRLQPPANLYVCAFRALYFNRLRLNLKRL